MTTASPPRVFVVGGIGMDDVVRVPHDPIAGGFVQATTRQRRVGGCAANIAVGVAATGLQAVLIGCVGTDGDGDLLMRSLTVAGVEARVTRRQGASPTSWVLLGPEGDRTIVGITDGLMNPLLSNADEALQDLKSGDFVVFPSWRSDFAALLNAATERGGRSVVGLRALSDPSVRAFVALGSEKELSGEVTDKQRERFAYVVVTRGSEGARAYAGPEVLERNAVRPNSSSPLDPVGAGDAFAAAIVTCLARNATLPDALEVAVAAGTSAVAHPASTPPPWQAVAAQLPGDLAAMLVPPTQPGARALSALAGSEATAGPAPVHPRLVDAVGVREALSGYVNVIAAWQYGSSLRDDYRPGHSDVDILVVVADATEPGEYSAIASALRSGVPDAEATLLTAREIRDGIHPGWSRHFFRNVARTGAHLFGPDVLSEVEPTSYSEARRRVVQLAQRARLVVANSTKTDEQRFWLMKYQHWVPLCLLELLDLAGVPHDQLHQAHRTFSGQFPDAATATSYPYVSLGEVHRFLEELSAWLTRHPQLFTRLDVPSEPNA